MKKILLIEPDKAQADIYKKALARSGYKMVLRVDAQSAILALDSQAIDAIILELNLPGNNGIEIIYELRSYPEWNNIPILIHTMLPEANFSPSSEVAKSLGIFAYLYKPTCNLERLLARVDEAFTSRISA